eukprot:CAMPEP_0116138246 /NCGR_PEP_ID=MMETSP0329-20121206/12684_1 /TAXON_ID=697910 /ORGANISM="Pseudo-nitzschia arenysensis, Strain B593" /LENGTH=116 /DNA_ID=CAMNT_0003633225 /DNA_START=255 /DNA_END=602 /DNA_ORIENTATION=+
MSPSNNGNSDKNSHYSKDLENGTHRLPTSAADTTFCISLKDDPSDISSQMTTLQFLLQIRILELPSRNGEAIRIDSSVLEMASSVKDEYDRRAEVAEEDQRKAELCCLFCCDLVRA